MYKGNIQTLRYTGVLFVGAAMEGLLLVGLPVDEPAYRMIEQEDFVGRIIHFEGILITS
jgi:hypothetical protein